MYSTQQAVCCHGFCWASWLAEKVKPLSPGDLLNSMSATAASRGR